MLKFFHTRKIGKERKSKKKKGRTNTGKQSDSPVFRNIIDLVVVWRYQKYVFPLGFLRALYRQAIRQLSLSRRQKSDERRISRQAVGTHHTCVMTGRTLVMAVGQDDISVHALTKQPLKSFSFWDTDVVCFRCVKVHFLFGWSGGAGVNDLV